jgi:hypothetical protein
MNRRANFTIAFLSVTIFSPATSVGHSANGLWRQQCSVAAQVLRSALDGEAGPSDVLSRVPAPLPRVSEVAPSGATKMVPLGRNSDFWRIGWTGETPGADLVREWYAVKDTSIAKCFRPWADDKPLGEIMTQVRLRSSTAPSRVQVSGPAFDRAHTRALLVISSKVQGGLGGHVEIVLVGRHGSTWRRIGSRGLSVS